MKNPMYRIALSGLLATGLTLGSAAAFAQQDNSAPATAQQGHKHMTPEEQVAHMAKRYSLTSDQQTQITPILANQRQQVKAVHEDSTLSPQDRMAKIQSIRADSTNKIQALLNDTQKQKFAQDQQRKQRRQQDNQAPAA